MLYPRRMASAATVLLVLFVTQAVAQSPEDVRWANDFLGPEVTLPSGRKGTAAVHYWTDVVGIAFNRDVTVDVPRTRLDLDLNGRPDIDFEAHWSLPGGILRNPRQIGLVSTPDDPPGTVGRYSVSTGFLGVREERDPATGRGNGRFGFNCWLCHATADDRGHIALGRPNTKIYLGLIMATARALQPDYVIRDEPDGPPLKPTELLAREGLDGTFDLDPNHDGQVTVAEWRSALKGFPAQETRASMLLAGPGRLDQSVDHRMDGLIPLANLQHSDFETYGAEKFLRRAHTAKPSLFNPLSIPGTRVGIAVAHYSWSGRDSSMREDAVAWLTEHLKMTPEHLAASMDFPTDAPIDYELLNRAITLDFRNVSTAGLEADDRRGIAWPHKMLTAPSESLMREGLELFGAIRVRRILTSPPLNDEHPTTRDAAIAAGRRIFIERNCGEIINQRVVFGREAHVPEQFKGMPVIAPLDRSKPLTAKIPVKCASCHNYSPTRSLHPLHTPLEDLQHCDLCHFDHPVGGRPGHFVAIGEHMRSAAIDSVSGCLQCHTQHPDFGTQIFSNSWLLPFDANNNSVTHGDERADGLAGGIGTDAAMNVDTNFNLQLRPKDRRPHNMYVLTRDAKRVPERPETTQQGFGWVRVAPLFSLTLTAPFLHNGSVPTLAALLDDPPARPAHFPVGWPEQRFEFDTALPGNKNVGHAFGTHLSAEEKAALASFLQSLP